MKVEDRILRGWNHTIWCGWERWRQVIKHLSKPIESTTQRVNPDGHNGLPLIRAKIGSLPHTHVSYSERAVAMKDVNNRGNCRRG